MVMNISTNLSIFYQVLTGQDLKVSVDNQSIIAVAVFLESVAELKLSSLEVSKHEYCW